MPELPEVETVRRGLVEHVVGRTVTTIQVLHPRATRRQPSDSDFASFVGQRVDDVRRRGKYLWFALTGGDAVIAHLGMSGQFRFVAPGTPDHPHLRIRLGLDGPAGSGPLDVSTDPARLCEVGAAARGAGERNDLWFLDQRTFGGMQLSPGGAELPAEIAHIGRDLLDPQLDRSAVVEQIRHKHVGIKRVLLDQTVTSGIGNIYADEALWAARIHGDRLADTLTRPRINQLLDATRTVFGQALAAGGTSFDALYVNVNGESGYFDRALNVYGQTDRPCPRCATPVRRSSFMNRSSHYCPVCQPVPRPRRAVAGTDARSG